MRFSIITVALNAEKHLEKCLRSVASQDLRSFEHILWDGGSKDRTLEIARTFSRLVIYQGQDLGLGDAMNQAVSFAKGEFLFFLPSDNLLAHRTVLHEVDTFLKAKPDALWAFGGTELIDAEGKPLTVPPCVPFDAKWMRRYNLIPYPATFVSSELFRRARGFRTDLRYVATEELWFRLAMFAPPLAMQTVVAKHRLHPDSLQMRERLHAEEEALQVQSEYTHSFFERRALKRKLRLASTQQSSGADQ